MNALPNKMNELTALIKQMELPLKQHYSLVLFYIGKMAGWMDKQIETWKEIDK